MPNQIQKIIEELTEKIVILYANYSGRESDNRSRFRKDVREQNIQLTSSLLHQEIQELEGMKKEHREFECNGAHGGKGCYESWCHIDTCTSKDAMHCKSYNQALTDLITKKKQLISELENNEN